MSLLTKSYTKDVHGCRIAVAVKCLYSLCSDERRRFGFLNVPGDGESKRSK